MNVKSINHKLVCKPYNGSRKPEGQVRSGVATIKQKTAVASLEVLADARINEQLTIKKGSFIHLSEEILFTRQNIMKVLESPSIGQPFVMVDFADVLFISEE